MMLRTFLPLPILGFVIFLIVDSQKRFKELKKNNPALTADYERQFALLLTLLIILILVLVSATMYGLMVDRPSLYKKVFGEPTADMLSWASGMSDASHISALSAPPKGFANIQ